MKKIILSAVSVMLITGMAGCEDKQTALEGDWRIDLDPMIQQARSLGASNGEIQQVKDTFIDGRMNIDAEKITLTIDGMFGSEILEYKISSKDGQCFNLAIQSAKAPHKYCVNENRLEIHDPGTKLITTYVRT
jgi:hypothetical protein